MLSLKKKEITKDVLMIFNICYEFSLSFKNVLRLYNISSKYFWIFLEIMSPMLKMGVRKAANMRKSIEKMYECLEDPSKSYEILTPREEKILETFKWFIEDCFSDGEGCLHISQFESIPSAKGYLSNGLLAASDFKNLKSRIDDVSFILMGDTKFYKTSKVMYYLEKFEEDLTERDLVRMSIKEIIDRITEGAERAREKEEKEYEAKASN